MVFSSVIFLFIFLPVVLTLHFLVPARYRNAYLLAASLFFYAWGEVFFLSVMLLSVCGNYAFGRWVAATDVAGSRRVRVGVAIAANLILLCFFKYTNAVAAQINELLLAAGRAPWEMGEVHLPLGISFFTFQAMSYVIDVYRGRVEAEKRFVNVALYVALFPQLIVGPIVRYRDIAAQIVRRHVSLDDLVIGIRRFIMGLGKKVLIADTLGAPVDAVYAIPNGQLPAGVAWVGGALFMLQLYFDFSGYSDMAIGLARMFGFRIRENFNYPYISRTLTEFWQRWHISLSTWFRDYLFNPLGSYRRGRARAYLNLMIVFFLCGLWHGSTWNFVVFGLAQGTVMIGERLVRANRLRLFQSPFGYVYHLLVIDLTFILFRSSDLAVAGHIYRAMLGLETATGEFHLGLYLTPNVLLAVAVAVIACLPVVPRLRQWLRPRPAWIPGAEAASACFLVAVLLLSVLELAAGTYSPFIYFRF